MTKEKTCAKCGDKITQAYRQKYCGDECASQAQLEKVRQYQRKLRRAQQQRQEYLLNSPDALEAVRRDIMRGL
jgi:hypothetical protein